MVTVYAWPPVGHVAAEWTVHDPVSRSRSLITGASYVSAAQRRRRVARLDVSALSADRNGSGYIEVLKRLVNGGVNLVRLHSTPIIWHLDEEAQHTGRAMPMSWIVPVTRIDWHTPPAGIQWWTDTPPQGTALSGNRVSVSGLRPDALAARPGELVTMGADTAMVMRPAYANASGVAVLHLLTPLTGSGIIVIGSRETGVFEADEMARAAQPVGQNWSHSWAFTEVFEDERGPFTEVDPWN